MDCADHCISSNCHPYCPWGNELHGRINPPATSKEILARIILAGIPIYFYQKFLSVICLWFSHSHRQILFPEK